MGCFPNIHWRRRRMHRQSPLNHKMPLHPTAFCVFHRIYNGNTKMNEDYILRYENHHIIRNEVVSYQAEDS